MNILVRKSEILFLTVSLICSFLVWTEARITGLQAGRNRLEMGMRKIKENLVNLQDLTHISQIYKYIGETVEAGLSDSVVSHEEWLDFHSNILHQSELLKYSHESEHIKFQGLASLKNRAISLHEALLKFINSHYEGSNRLKLSEMEIDGKPLHEVVILLMAQVKLGLREHHHNIHKLSSVDF